MLVDKRVFPALAYIVPNPRRQEYRPRQSRFVFSSALAIVLLDKSLMLIASPARFWKTRPVPVDSSYHSFSRWRICGTRNAASIARGGSATEGGSTMIGGCVGVGSGVGDSPTAGEGEGSADKRQFMDIARKDGLRAAIAWRDARFAQK